MFSHTVGSLFILTLFSLAVQKLSILMRSHLFILSFMSLALGHMSVRMLLRGMSEIFLPMFSSRIFMVLHSREKEGAYTLCDSMDGTGEHYAK